MPARPRRILAPALAGLVVAATALVEPSAARAADPPDLTGLSYVALGDSYSAGFGILPFTDLPASGCFQAEANYPHLVAAELGLALDDRTCSGATTLDVTTTPQPTITGAGTAPVQADSLSAATRLVTITIGGNDLGFSDVALSCLADSAVGPLVTDIDGATYQYCKDYYVRDVSGFKVDLLADRIDQVVAPRLLDTFALIAQRAPNAKVVVIGYPTVAPDLANVPTGGCYRSPLGTGTNPFEPPFPQNSFPFSEVDTLYLHGVEAKLDAAIQEAARIEGATYVSTLDDTAAHSACSTDAPYVAGITLTTDLDPNVSQPIPDTSLGVLLGALHPNTAGVGYLQTTVAAAIRSAFTTVAAAPPSVAPTLAAAPELPATGASDPTPVALAGGLVLLAGGVAVAVSRRRRSGDRAG